MYALKETIEWRGSPQNGRKYLQSIYLIMDYHPKYITLIAQQWQKKKKLKTDKEFEKPLLQKDIQIFMANKYMKRCPTSLIIRKMQINFTMGCQLSSIKITYGKEKDSIRKKRERERERNKYW